MPFSTTDTTISYNGDGVDDTFAIPFAFTTDSVIYAELWDNTDPDAPTEVTPFNSPTQWEVVGTDVVTADPVPDDHIIIIYRETAGTHPTVYDTYRFPYPTATVDFDRIYQLAQELRENLSRCVQLTLFEQIDGIAIPSVEDLTEVIASTAAIDAAVAAAQLAETNAETAETNAEAAQAAAEAAQAIVETYAGIIPPGDQVLSNNATTVFADIIVDTAELRWASLEFFVYRKVTGSYKWMRQEVSIVATPDGSNDWELDLGASREAIDAMGITWGLNYPGAGQAQLKATLDNMAGASHLCTAYWVARTTAA